MALIAVVDDLFFAVKIQETARQTGVAVEIASTAKFRAALEAPGAEEGIDTVIVDLNSPAALDVIRSLKQEERTRSLRVVGFASHVAADVIAAARAAGSDQVLARSAFTKQLPDLLRSLSQESGIKGQGLGNGTPTQEIQRFSNSSS